MRSKKLITSVLSMAGGHYASDFNYNAVEDTICVTVSNLNMFRSVIFGKCTKLWSDLRVEERNLSTLLFDHCL